MVCVPEFMATPTKGPDMPCPFHRQSMWCDFCSALLSSMHALLLPGRIPGYSRDDLQLLLSSTSKRAVLKVCHDAAKAEGTIHPVAYLTFCYLWQTLMPSVIVMKPRSCRTFAGSVSRTVLLSSAWLTGQKPRRLQPSVMH